MLRSSLYTFAAIAAARLAVAKQVGYFDADQCAAPDDFGSCYDDADEWLSDCINENCNGLGVDCHNACECAHQNAYTRCAASYCWNMVYSCEYQLQVSDALSPCVNPDIETIPFWPPPDNANGRCSCNLGKINKAQVIINQAIETCGDIVDASTMSAAQIRSLGTACLCCGLSGLLSSYDAFCPRLDLGSIGLDNFENSMAQLYSASIDWPECSSRMSGYDCAADFGYPSNIDTYYQPGAVPTGGAETLHNIGALTTPVSQTATFIIGNEQYLITAVSTDAAVPTEASNSSGAEDNQDSNNDETQDDFAVRQMGISSMLAGFAAAIAGLLIL
ncbi:hypothetical protein BJY01DRAFT_200560 [Aspergillus pseudoustus]|uniref:Extracellular membrane protein CFEM domain-containing protein n=1 Tax=Aspergillus pseudoustus TaxID=1810923 RepID=A0ABR4JRT3_9EURO